MTDIPFGSSVTASRTCLTLAFQMFIAEERCVPKCSSIEIATEFCPEALKELLGKKEKELCKLQAGFMKVESNAVFKYFCVSKS